MPEFNKPTTELSYLEKDDVLMAGSPSAFSNIKAQNVFSRALTYVQLQALVTASELIPMMWYKITDATTSNVPILVQAKTTSTIFKNCNLVSDYFDIMEYDFDTNIFTGIDFLAGTIRNSGGTWSYVDDAEHDKRNLATVTTNENFAQINYRRTDYNRVVSLVATPDESYATKGVTCGASVGLTFSQIKLQRNDSNYGYIFYQSGSFNKLYDRGIISAVFNNGNGDLTITHEDFGDEFQITLQGRYGIYVPQIQSVGTNTTIIRFFDWGGNVITTPDVNMIVFFSRVTNKQLTNVTSEITGSNIWISGQMMKEIA